ncbi:MAG: nucleoside phosphorylase [Erysipelotrichales bacterium]|nr:nucleoside phosphorylase [Erysipelotrichales bacterium]
MKYKSMKLTLPDGGMHHLGAKKEDVAERMILTNAVEDVPVIAKHFENARETASHREYLSFKGEVNGMPVGVVSVGHGCMPMAIAVEELNHLEVKTMIKVGFGQAIVPGIKPGTVILPSAAVRSEGASKEYIPESYPAVADLRLLGRLAEECEKAGLAYETGIIRTHDSFYLEQPCDPEGLERVTKWAKLGVLMNEHECAPLFVLSQLFKLQAGAVYIVQENLADGTKLEAQDAKQLYDRVIEVILKAIA